MTNPEKLIEDTKSHLQDLSEKSRLLAKIPPELVEEARATGKGYVFKLINDRSKKTDRIKRDWTAKKFFLDKGDTILFKKDPKIKLKVVNDREVEMKGKNGKKVVLSFAAAQRELDTAPAPWQNVFVKEDEEHGMETLANRRDRIVDSKLAL